MKLEEFFQKFDRFADAPDAVRMMRTLIISLATSGKIVPQAAGDQPASMLVDLAQQERRDLEGSRMVSKQRPLDPVQGEQVPYNIPAEWCWTRLGSIGVIFNGDSINADEKQRRFVDVAGWPYVATKDVGYGFEPIDYDNGIYIPESEAKFKIAHPGSTLICAEGGSAGRKCGITNRDICFGNKLFCNEPLAGIDAKYVLYWYLSPRFLDLFDAVKTGIIGGVSIAKFIELPIPLPPKGEQHRIVAKADELMALCGRLEEQQQERDTQRAALARASLARFSGAPTPSNLNFLFHKSYDIDPVDLRKSILTLAVQGKLVHQDPNDEDSAVLVRKIAEAMRDLVNAGSVRPHKNLSAVKDSEKAFPLPEGWIWARLQEVIDVRDGTHDSPKDCIEPDAFPLVTSRNFENGDINFESARRISAKDHFEIQKRSKVEKHDILFSMIGGNIGNQVIVKTNASFSVKNVALFKYYDRALTYPLFIKRYMEHLAVRLQQEAIGGAQPFVSLGYLRKLPIALPPTMEQRRIVAKVDRLMALVDELEAQLATSRATAKNLLDAIVIEFTAAGTSSPEVPA